MADMSLTIAAMFTFSISRFLLRETIQDRFGTYLAPFQRSLESNVGYYLLMLRLIHTPFSFVNYGAGATINVPMKTFWWTTQLGLLPATMIFVYAGTRLPSLASMAEQGVFSLLDSHLILALLAAPALTWLVRQIVRHTGMFRSIVD